MTLDGTMLSGIKNALHWECKNSPSHDFSVKNRDDSGKGQRVTEADEECPSRMDAKCPGVRASGVESSTLRLGCQEETGECPPEVA